ncbi:MAG: DUF3124 domain-containing protein [Rhodocyclaceae bacterium]|nr:MAG: DUF3124 domain-containing protein [Rhodocyclaceae bacterium]
MSTFLRHCTLLFGLLVAGAFAADEPALLSGQTLYLPIYSHVYHGDPGKAGKPTQTLVSTHVSIRNTDPQTRIRLVSARYYDTDGKLVRPYIDAPVTIPPLGTHEIFVPRTDTAGGSGASFLIVWNAETPVNPPIVEALHADIREARTLMFITTGQPIRTR